MIKSFNEYMGSDSDDVNYQNIYYGQWFDEVIGDTNRINFRRDNWDRFTDGEVNKIANLFDRRNSTLYWMLPNNQIYSDNQYLQPLCVCFLIVRKSYEYINIYKLKDEWFYIYNKNGLNGEYYKCDQIGGLIQCIKDNII